VSRERPLGTSSATDEVIDAIADIEMQRRETEKEAGLAASCSAALRRLHELLDHEKEALQLRGPDAGHSGNNEPLPRSTKSVMAKRTAESRQEQGAPDDGPSWRPVMSDER
jgi:hypothetical protein